MIPSVVRSILTFLNGNSGAIAAVATTAGVIIAALYTFYTTRLWRVSVQQARSAALQAESAQRQLRLMEQQMAVAERTFETVHRPQLLIEAQVDSDGPPDLLPDLLKGKTRTMTIFARNFGATAATVISAECRVTGERGQVWAKRLLPIVIPPGETEGMGRAILPSIPDVDLFPNSTEEMMNMLRWFHVYIRYRGLSESEYLTQAQICLMPDLKDKTRWEILKVTSTGPEFWEIHKGENETGLGDN